MTGNRFKGFTLLELIIVLFLITVIVGIAAAFSFSRVSSAQFDGTAREMAVLLKEARLRACMTGEKQILEIRMSERRYGIAGQRTREIPPGIQIRVDDPIRGEIEQEHCAFVFYPSGHVEGDGIFLLSGSRKISIVNDPVVGCLIMKEK